MTSRTTLEEIDIIGEGLKKWNNDKGEYKDCDKLDTTDYDDNYLNIGISTINKKR